MFDTKEGRVIEAVGLASTFYILERDSNRHHEFSVAT
jgi:hypothetical protein